MKNILEQYQQNVRTIDIDLENLSLPGLLHIPEQTQGLVIFVHGSGSSRFSTRNQLVASYLSKANFATLLFDLLTPDEEQIDLITREFRFDISLLSKRLIEVTAWCAKQRELKKFAIGYFGSSTGAAAALNAAAYYQDQIKSVVSRGGRPDLSFDHLEKVTAATLLIVGSLDTDVIQLNQLAQAQMRNINKLVLIEGATHLFEEHGTLEQVAQVAVDWFQVYLY